MLDRKAERKARRAKGFVHTKRRRQNLKAWVQFQRQRFNFEEERKKNMQIREKTIKDRCGPWSDTNLITTQGRKFIFLEVFLPKYHFKNFQFLS